MELANVIVDIADLVITFFSDNEWKKLVRVIKKH